MHVLIYIHVGAGRKRTKFQDEILEHMERRRSSRIIALEEKKQQEKERKLALALEKKNSLANRDNRSKEKGKAIMDMEAESDSDEDEKECPIKRGRKSKALHQLISSIKEFRRQSQNTNISETNVSSLNGVPLKQILEIIIDFLQRNDPDELFAEPVNPDVVKNYYEIVKQPMDFGTMRAKLHEGMYTNLEQFKAEVISSYTKWIFERLSADPEHFNSEFSPKKKRPGRKPQNGKPRTPRLAKASPKPTGTHLMAPETKRRDIYWPPSNPLFADFQFVNDLNLQLNINPSNYKDSLLSFVEDLGPTVQKIAEKKLEPLNSQQLLNHNIPTQNLLENASGTQIVHQPTPQTPTQPALFNPQTLSLARPFFNRSFTASGLVPKENRNITTIKNPGSVNIKDGEAHKANNKDHGKDSWKACAAALLGNFFLNSNKGGIASGIENSNGRETINFSKEKMASPLENVSSHLGPVQRDTKGKKHMVELDVNKTGNTRQWNSYSSMPYTFPGSSSNVTARVYPTRVISGPPLKPMTPMLSDTRNSLSGSSLLPQPKPQYTMPSINPSELSLVPQSRLQNYMSCMPYNNLSELSLVHQPRQANSMSSMNPSGVSYPLSQPKQGGWSISSNNFTGLPILPSQTANFSNESNTYLYDLDTPYQPGDFQAMLGSPDFNNNTFPIQASHAQVLHQASPYAPPVSCSSNDMEMQIIRELTHHGSAPLQEPKSSSSLGMAIGGGGAMNYYGSGGALVGQPEQANPQLLWDNDQQPNLALQL
ncbi:hypothetical protein VNO77_43478 [Canavalia gladiata]|uniref:Bromo domain-containing protein n=1 Tax=Canavalia gladiata TaxID=3824 RepID=A0AAN9JX64_CANGL